MTARKYFAGAVVGAAAMEADNRVREEGGNNRGPRVAEYLASLDPPLAEGAPWCAAFVQYVSDVAARAVGVPNPLDAVRLEAYVQSYVDQYGHAAVAPELALPGDLVCFSFGGERWDHIGILSRRVAGDSFWTIEGNTGTESERDGDGVAVKPRTLSTGTREPLFLRWTEALE